MCPRRLCRERRERGRSDTRSASRVDRHASATPPLPGRLRPGTIFWNVFAFPSFAPRRDSIIWRGGKGTGSGIRGADDESICPWKGLHAVGAVQLYHFVVHAEDQEGRRPLSDEIRFLLRARNCEDERRAYGPERRPQEPVGRNLGRLLFDRPGDGPFALARLG